MVIQSEDALLAELIREAERYGSLRDCPAGPKEHVIAMLTRNHSRPPTHRSKMVNVQDDHPFMLVPPLRPSPSPSPPSGSQPWTPDGDYPEHSPGRVNEDSHSEPILDVKLIKAPRSKSRKMNGLGRGRDRTRANGSPLVVNGDGKLPDLSVKASVR